MDAMIAQEELAPIIGAQVVRRRKAKNLQQQELAKQLGISLPHLNRIENGKALPGTELLFALADELGCDTDDLRQVS